MSTPRAGSPRAGLQLAEAILQDRLTKVTKRQDNFAPGRASRSDAYQPGHGGKSSPSRALASRTTTFAAAFGSVATAAPTTSPTARPARFAPRSPPMFACSDRGLMMPWKSEEIYALSRQVETSAVVA